MHGDTGILYGVFRRDRVFRLNGLEIVSEFDTVKTFAAKGIDGSRMTF